MFMGELGKNKYKVTSQRKKPITQQPSCSNKWYLFYGIILFLTYTSVSFSFIISTGLNGNFFGVLILENFVKLVFIVK